MKTKVGIIGGGPSGMLLGQILSNHGIDNVVLEKQTKEYVLNRVRAGLIEEGTQMMLRDAGVGERMDREGLRQPGFYMAFDGRTIRVDCEELTGGKATMVYGQADITHDLYAARTGVYVDKVENLQPHDLTTDTPYITFSKDEVDERLDCDFIAACDGYYGVGRKCIPDNILKTEDITFPFKWLGILSKTKPIDKELVYAQSPNGFALFSHRTPEISRTYLQCSATDNIEEWTDDRFWEELRARLPYSLSSKLKMGPSIEKTLFTIRHFLAEPLQYGRIFLAGDAGHIVPPSAAKGLNLAMSDIYYLSNALIEFYKDDTEVGLNGYSDRTLVRVKKAQNFSLWLTDVFHTYPGSGKNTDWAEDGTYDKKVELLHELMSSRETLKWLAENYVGLPY